MTTLGLRANAHQFWLLVVVNAFVGALVGLERSILPSFAEAYFEVRTHTAILSFIIAFGISKAVANYFVGRLANSLGRKRILVLGWFLAIPVPVLLLYAHEWYVVVAANVLLGISQGFTWSCTVIMKIDLVGQKERGLAMGLNEFAGYLAVGIMAFVTGWLASEFAIKPYPFYLGIALALIGLLLSIFWVKDTHPFVQLESKGMEEDLKEDSVFLKTTFTDKTLSAVTQAGLVNNLNDGMIWGLLPIVMLNLAFNTTEIGCVASVYPIVWGVGQVFTGRLADLKSKKGMLVWGMFIQGLALLGYALTDSFAILIFCSISLGLGTALVYPTFLAMIADHTHPQKRAESIGVFRLWRDLGYAIGAILSGLIADAFGIQYAIWSIAILTFCSSLILKLRIPQDHRRI